MGGFKLLVASEPGSFSYTIKIGLWSAKTQQKKNFYPVKPIFE